MRRGSTYRRTTEAPPAEARANALTEWRRLDVRPLETAWKSSAQPLSELVPQLQSKLRWEERLNESSIRTVWGRVLDPTLTAHAQPVGLRHGTLFVTVDSNVWLSEIVRYHRHEILERLQLSVGRDHIQKISFRLG
jgi:predicted nucleic acid-binding Zn ribbon protein